MPAANDHYNTLSLVEIGRRLHALGKLDATNAVVESQDLMDLALEIRPSTLQDTAVSLGIVLTKINAVRASEFDEFSHEELVRSEKALAQITATVCRLAEMSFDAVGDRCLGRIIASHMPPCLVFQGATA